MDYTGLKLKSANFPGKPGVYIMKNTDGGIIYIGKAKNLKNRVKSYFTEKKSLKTDFLVRNIEDIDIIITKTEQEALLLENNLIKKWKPKYNIDLKDGKTYPVIRITNDVYPGIFRTRRIVFDGSLYYGPFPGARQIDTYLKLIDKIFPLRKCRGKLKKREHPCLNYYIGRCLSPCTGRIGKNEYNGMVEQIKKLLSGKGEDLIKEMKTGMLKASENLDFEEAAKLRDNINAVKFIQNRQYIVDFDTESRDYIGFGSKGCLFTFVILQMREGKLIGRETFHADSYADEQETFYHFIFQYYSQTQNLPRLIYIPEPVNTDQMNALMSQLKSPLIIKTPRRGRHLQTLLMALENAGESLNLRLSKHNRSGALETLKEALGMAVIPRRIEGFDIAHLAGEFTVASMVSFKNGLPDKKSYRRFKIRSLKGKIDDFEAMREVLARRYTRVINEKIDKPDLILVDGGKGQLGAAKEILDSLGLKSIDIAGLAKKNEEIFIPEKNEPIILDKDSDALRLLQHIRDESHRFANTFHQKLRKKSLLHSELTEIPGIGKKRSIILLKEYKSIKDIKAHKPEEISKKTGFSLTLSARVISRLSELHSRKKVEE
ncbi:MAG: excinuclease ABC subunit UvrC [Spirochaetes bacterium]|nr:excinuclease ABC subunit UvrC [Spirochaetota bacterium]